MVFEQVAAAGAADPVGLALVADLDRAAALGNDAERVRIVPGEGDPLAGVADLAEPREGVTLGVFGLQQDEHAVVVQRVIEIRRNPPAGALASAVRDSLFLSPTASPAKVRDVPSARVASKTNAPTPSPAEARPP